MTLAHVTSPKVARVSAAESHVAGVVAAARDFVQWRRWYSELPDDRPLPGRLEAALDDAVRALDALDHPRSPT